MPSALAFAVNGNRSCKVRISFDTMCQDSFISERVAKNLNLLSNEVFKLNVDGFGGELSSFSTESVQFCLSSIFDKKDQFLVNALVKKGTICAPLDAVNVNFDKCSHLKGLKIADKLPRNVSKVDILIGLNHYLHLVTGDIIRHPSESDKYPAAMKTVFGYVLMGTNACCMVPKRRVCMFTKGHHKPKMEMEFERFWNLESIGIYDKKFVYTNEEK